jgi:hypothetical protein
MLARACLLLLALVFPPAVHAQGQGCGDPPPVANEALKGEIEGKAQFLSRFLGDAALSGAIQTSRTEIFSKYPDAEQSRSNAYFEYQVCLLIFNDKTMSTGEKLDQLVKIRREFAKPARIEGRLDGQWSGEGTFFSDSEHTLKFDLFVESKRLFGTVQIINLPEMKVTDTSVIESTLSDDGLLENIEFKLDWWHGGSWHRYSFNIDGDLVSGRISSPNVSAGSYSLRRVR